MKQPPTHALLSAVVATVLALSLAGSAHAGGAPGTQPRRALQEACFAPSALGAVAGEERAVKGDRRFSTPMSRTPVAAADPIPQGLRGAIRRVDLPPGKKLIALTFDLCEDNFEVAGYEGRIIDTLRKENVKATLFAGGKWMRSHKARAEQLMSDPLFEIANHSEAHRNLRLLNGAILEDEILGPQRAYEAIRSGLAQNQCTAAHSEALQSVAPRMSLFRFPFGACNPQALKAVNDAGLLAIQWDVSTGDPDPRTSAAAIARTMVKRAKPGSILIAHANGRGWNTHAALPVALAALKKEGYEFVTVSELLAAGTPVVSATCYDSRPGDTDRYDNLLALAAARKRKLETTWGLTEIFKAPAAGKPRTPARRKKDTAGNGAKPAQQSF